MSAETDKTQGIAFCYTNIYSLYKTKKKMSDVKIITFKVRKEVSDVTNSKKRT